MPRIAKTLSMAQIKKLPRGLHAVGDGLYVKTGVSGRRWKLRRYLDGRQRLFDLGNIDAISIDQARLLIERFTGGKSTKAPPIPVAADTADNPFLGPIARALLEATA